MSKIDEIEKAVDDELMRQYEANKSWEDAKDVVENLDAKAIVRAALSALREPDDKMIGMGAGLSDFGFTRGVIETIDDYKKEIAMIFSVMIDTALTRPGCRT